MSDLSGSLLQDKSRISIQASVLTVRWAAKHAPQVKVTFTVDVSIEWSVQAIKTQFVK